MGKVALVFWCSIDLFMAAMSRFGPPPFNEIFFVLTVSMLLIFTWRGVLMKAQAECKFEAIKRQFDLELKKHLDEQRKVLTADFEEVTGNRFHHGDVAREKRRLMGIIKRQEEAKARAECRGRFGGIIKVNRGRVFS